jgi:hypothetical protein
MDAKEELRIKLLAGCEFVFCDTIANGSEERVTSDEHGFDYFLHYPQSNGVGPEMLSRFDRSEIDDLLARLESTGALALYAKLRK